MTTTDSTEERLKEIIELNNRLKTSVWVESFPRHHVDYLLDLVEKYRSVLKLYEHISHKTGEKDVSKFSAAAEALRG